MASERKQASLRDLAWLVSSALGFVVLALLSALWLIGTESGARAAFAMLRQWSGNAIVTQSVQGRLIGPLVIGKLRLEKDGNSVLASQLTLHWEPRALRDGLLHVSLLQADQLKLILAAQDDKKPQAFPALPFRLQLDQIEINALSFSGLNKHPASWQERPLRVTASATLDKARLVVSAARIGRGKGSANFAGSVDLSSAHHFSVRGEFQQIRVQDYGQLSDWPEMMLNGSFAAQGTQHPHAQVQVQFALTDSRINQQRLSAEGQFSLDAEQLYIPRLRVVAGTNALSLQGRLQAKASTLQGVQFTLQAPHLSELGAGLSGAMQASGTANGTLLAPTIKLQGQTTQLRLPGDLMIGSANGNARIALNLSAPIMVREVTTNIRATNLARQGNSIAALQLQLQASPDATAPLRINTQAEKIALAGQKINTLTLTVDGTARQHKIAAQIDGGARNMLPDLPFSLRLSAQGGVSDLATSPQWQGLLTSATLDGKYPAQLKGNAPILLSAQRIQVKAMALATPYGQVLLDDFSRDGTKLASRGSFSDLSLAGLLRFFNAHPIASTDLMLGGDWDLRLSDELEGEIKLRRTAGDIRVRSQPPLALGLQKFEASAQARDGRLSVTLAAQGSQLGVVSLSGTSTGRAGNEALLPDAQSPLQAELTMSLPSIAWVGPMVSPALITAGSLRGKVALSGTLAEPHFGGQIAGQKLRVYLVGSGIDLQQGVLEGDFTDDTLQIRQLHFSGGDGEIAATGSVTLKAGKVGARLQMRATRFTVLDRVDRKLTLSGNTMLAIVEGRARLDGELKVDAGLVDVGRLGEPQLSDDVVILGREAQQRKALAADIDVTVDFGENLLLRGQGLKGRIGGDLHITSVAGGPLQARGLLKVVRGTYTAYGRELAIERGNLRFDGAPGNPALDIRAMRRGLEVEPGVAIGGSALAPRVMLVSEPQVPDTEKLSWLVLGQGLTAAGSTEMGALQSAAASLLSQGAAASMQSQLAGAFGVDTITLSQSRDNLQQRIITVGKRVSSRLMISYQQGLQSAGNAVVFRYTLSPRLSVEAETGTRSVFSLFYNFAFD